MNAQKMTIYWIFIWFIAEYLIWSVYNWIQSIYDIDNSVKLNLTLILFNKERKWYIINLLVMTFGLINKLTVCQNGFWNFMVFSKGITEHMPHSHASFSYESLLQRRTNKNENRHYATLFFPLYWIFSAFKHGWQVFGLWWRPLCKK